MTDALLARAGASLPRAMGSEGALEAAYRFLGNDEVRPRSILAPHIEATADRVAAAGVAYCISDTTEMRFGGAERDGLGPQQGDGRGFLAHIGLAVAADGSRLPLDVLGFETIVRPEEPKARRDSKKSRQAADSESLKWSRVAFATEEALGLSIQTEHKYIDEGFSGSRLDRPGLDRLRTLRSGQMLPFSTAPYGYTILRSPEVPHGLAVVDEIEAEYVRAMYRSKRLNAQGVRPRRARMCGWRARPALGGAPPEAVKAAAAGYA